MYSFKITERKSNLKITLISILSFFALSACSSGTRLSQPIPESEFSHAEKNSTYFTRELSCLGGILDKQQVKQTDRFSIAVGSIIDRTGKIDQFGAGAQVTQGAADIATTALFHTGAFRVNERVDIGVHSFEVDYANQGFLRQHEYQKDDRNHRILRNNNQGDVVGTNFYLAGAITEVNYNIASGGYEADIQGFERGKRIFSMSIAIDLRLVDTVSLEIIDAVSVKKVLKGYETKWGVFDFMDTYLIDISGGEKVQEPLQLGIRATIEEGIMKLASRAYNFNVIDDSYTCDNILVNNILFDFDEHKKMSKVFQDDLDKMATYLIHNPDISVNLTGHADKSGEVLYNSQLGMKRANRIGEYLIYKGVNPSTINYGTQGDKKPYLGISLSSFHYLDRRVEIQLENRKI